MSHAREERNQRLSLRLTTPLYVTVGDERVLADDWSLGGCGVTLAQRHAKGGSLPLRLEFPLLSGQVSLDGPGLVTFSGEDGRHGLSFTHFQPDTLEIVRQMWQGAMLGQQPALDALPQGPRDTAPPPLSLRRRLVAATLLAAALVILALIGAGAYSNLLVIEASHAAITVPVVTLRSPADGYFTGPALAPGAVVPAGTPLFDLAGPRDLAEIDLADAELRNLGTAIAAGQQRRQALQQFFGDYRDLADYEARRQEAARDGAVAALALAEIQLRRLEELAATGHAAVARVDQAKTEWLEREHRLASAEAAVKMALANRRMARQGRWFTGSRVEGIEPAKLDEDIRQAEADFDLQARRLAALIERREALVVTSPCDCVVVQAPVRSGEWLRAGSVVYLLRPRHEAAYLTAKVAQDKVDLLAQGDTAAIRLAGRDRIDKVAVLAINREPAAEVRYGLAADVANDPRWATLILALPASLTEPVAGLPAQVRLTVPPRRRLLGWLGG